VIKPNLQLPEKVIGGIRELLDLLCVQDSRAGTITVAYVIRVGPHLHIGLHCCNLQLHICMHNLSRARLHIQAFHPETLGLHLDINRAGGCARQDVAACSVGDGILSIRSLHLRTGNYGSGRICNGALNTSALRTALLSWCEGWKQIPGQTPPFLFGH
jgi:hypothetical protein